MPDLPPPSAVLFPGEGSGQAIYWISTPKTWREFGPVRLSFGVTDTGDYQPSFTVNPFNAYVQADIKYLSHIAAQIGDLLTPDEAEDFVKSSVATWAVQVLFDCALISKTRYNDRRIPYARVSPDLAGGLRVEWVNKESGVRLVVPADTSKAYIYYEEGNNFAMESATPESLAKRLQIIRQ